MSVRKINNVWYVDLQFNKKRIRRVSPLDSKGGAQAYESSLRQKLARGEKIIDEVEEDVLKYEQFVWQWFDIYVVVNNKNSEILNKKHILNKHLVPYFGKCKLDAIDELKIENFKSCKLKENVSRKTINNVLTVLRTSLKSAKSWKKLKLVPDIQLFKTPQCGYDFLTIEESQVLLDSSTDMWRLMILTGLKTGLRLGELIGLRWEDINFRDNRLYVKRSIVRNVIGSPKSNKERFVPMTQELHKALYEKRQSLGYIFTTRKDCHLSTNNTFLNLRKICKRAGLRNIGWHTLRHTFASHLAMVGAPVPAIQRLLGHSDIATTMRYTHLSPSTLDNTVKLLEPNNNFGHCGVNEGIVYEIVGENIVSALPNNKTKTALSDCF